jgi:hypothetical protein
VSNGKVQAHDLFGHPPPHGSIPWLTTIFLNKKEFIMKFLNEYLGVIIGLCMIGYAINGTINETSGVGFIGIIGFFIIVASIKYHRFTIPFANLAVERRRYQKSINPKYDRRTKHYS